MKRLAIVLSFLASAALAQYDDYPVGEYDYRHHRVVVSPVKVFGGMDPTKRDEGPKVDLIWVPGIDIQEIRYEYVDGPQGTFGWGPIANVYLGLDSVKANSVALGLYGRIYSGLGTGSYVQMGAQYYYQLGTKLFDGQPHTIYTLGSNGADSLVLPSTEVSVQGPQISPVLGIQKIYDRRWIVEAQMGFTVGWYTTSWKAPAPEKFEIRRGEALERYQTTSDWGGFYFVQLAAGVAF